MLANNEVGTIQPLAAVAELVRTVAPDAAAPHRRRPGPAAGSTSPPLAAPADLVSVSAHKFGGPKGVGALVVRDGTDLAARQLGGGQERERRSGTPDVAGIVAMAVAAAAAVADRADRRRAGRRLRDRLVDGLVAAVPDLIVTGRRDGRDGRRPAPIGEPVASPASATSASPGSRARRCSSCSSRTRSSPRPPRRAPAAPWSRPTCWPPWASPASWRSARCGCRSDGRSTDADVDLALAVVPPAIERLRQFAAPAPA